MYSHSVKKSIVIREPGDNLHLFDGYPPLLQRIFSSRGIQSPTELERTLDKLPSPWLLSNMAVMADQLVEALADRQKITVVADFDADGATSCAVAVKGLTALGAENVSYVVPNRFEYGYGLTPEIVEIVKKQAPDIIITVDNGISSIDGVKAAQASGIKVLVTDHHLPGAELPPAEAIVNPNLPDDKFPSKALAGVGVIFYVLLALRQRLRERGWFLDKGIAEPKLGELLDFVALGTVADVVPLDYCNRILVHQGLGRIRFGHAHQGIRALIELTGRNPRGFVPADLGFAIGPRLNAAGRLDDMSLGIQCLLSEDMATAKTQAQRLDALNSERKEIESQMKQEALALLKQPRHWQAGGMPSGVCLYDENWHQGVIGILAGRIKDQLHRPVIAFAPSGKDQIKGSARSIPDLHIRDALSDVAAAHPGILSKFGGHAMAAGLTIRMHDYPAFVLAFDEVVRRRLAGADPEQKIWTDGELDESSFNLELADLLRASATWGQHFPEPVFCGKFDIIQLRILGGQHLKMVVRKPGGNLLLDAIAFFVDNAEQWLGSRVCQAAYKLDINEFRGQRSLQLQVQYMEKIA
jgi:single-stranded-DNA-specific exonuclease